MKGTKIFMYIRISDYSILITQTKSKKPINNQFIYFAQRSSNHAILDSNEKLESMLYLHFLYGPHVLGHIRTGRALIVSANINIGYYRIYEWITKARMTLCTCTGWSESESEQFAHVRRQFFALRVPYVHMLLLLANYHMCWNMYPLAWLTGLGFYIW